MRTGLHCKRFDEIQIVFVVFLNDTRIDKNICAIKCGNQLGNPERLRVQNQLIFVRLGNYAKHGTLLELVMRN